MSQANLQDSIVIRKMTLTDLPQVEVLERLSFSHPWPAGSFEYELKHNAFSTCLVAVDTRVPFQKSLIGTIVAWRIADSLEIGTIAVHKDFQHQGIGRNLLAHAILQSQTDKVTEVILEVRQSNVAALKLYLGLGFEIVGIRPGYYEDNNEDALLLTLKSIDFKQIGNLITLKTV